MKSREDIKEALEFWKEALKGYEDKECFKPIIAWHKGKIEAYQDVLEIERER